MFKKSLLLTLTLAAAALSAEARTLPVPDQAHVCYYYQNGYYIGQGISKFDVSGNLDLQRGIEYWTLNNQTDNRRVTFAKPVDKTDGSTSWEFTANYDHQCKNAQAYGYAIFFRQCSNGQERDCWLSSN